MTARENSLVRSLADAHREIGQLRKQRDIFRLALVNLVGTDDPKELSQMAEVLRSAPVEDSDKAASLFAINILIENQP